jgi:hypothetical protein
MAATLTVTPDEIQEGDNVDISGAGFLPNTVVLVEVLEYGASSEILSDGGGAFSNNDLVDKAVATLTSDGTNVTADDTVTVDSVTYTFKAAVTTTANEVKIGADAAESLANLKHAINLDGTAGVYGSATVVHPTVGAGALTATTLQLYAKTGGTAGNSLVSTEASTHLSFGGTTFSGGAVATGISSLTFAPIDQRPITIRASDGVSTVTVTKAVWSQ